MYKFIGIRINERILLDTFQPGNGKTSHSAETWLTNTEHKHSFAHSLFYSIISHKKQFSDAIPFTSFALMAVYFG